MEKEIQEDKKDNNEAVIEVAKEIIEKYKEVFKTLGRGIPDIERRFTYHKPDEIKVKKFPIIRDLAKELAYAIVEQCPECREQKLALEKVEEAVMWANAGISRE